MKEFSLNNYKLRAACFVFTIVYFFAGVVSPIFAQVTYTYDANGNMTSDGQNCYTYNDANQLSKVTKCASNQTIAEYVYDYQGNRIVKKVYNNGSLQKTVYSPNDGYETVKNASNGATANTTYYQVNDINVAQKTPDGSKNYLLTDNLGSANVIINQNGNVIENSAYYPYGQIRSGGTKTKYLYTGQENDPETNLDYYNARYYSPDMMHFTQPDTYTADIYNPQDLNEYSYVKNNPETYNDPTGHFAWIPFIIIGTGAALGATEAVADYSQSNPNATWQDKTLVGAGGAVLGAGGAAAGMYLTVVGGSAAVAASATVAVGGLSNGAQQVYDNAISQRPLLQNVPEQVAAGAVTTKLAGPVTNKLVPQTVGRPVTKIMSYTSVSQIKKNSAQFVKKNVVGNFVNTTFSYSASVISSLFNTQKPNKKR